MTDFAFAPAWRDALAELELTPDSSTTPAGETGQWAETLMTFTTHGFLLLFLQPQGGQLGARLELTLPQGKDTAAFGRELAARMRALGADSAELSAEGPPTILKIVLPDFDGHTDQAIGVLSTLLKASDYLQQLEDDASTPSPLTSHEPDAQDDGDEDEDEAPARAAGAFENIGADEGGDGEAPARAAGAFESIGGGEAKHERRTARGEASASSSGDSAPASRVLEYDVEAGRQDVRAAVAFDGAPGERLREGLRRAMRARLDAHVEWTESVDHDLRAPSDQLVCMILTPGLTTAGPEEVRQLSRDLRSYFKRIEEFGELGMDLGEVLGVGAARPAPRRERDETDRRTRRDLPSLRRDEPPASPEADEEEADEAGEGFVLDLSASSPASEELEPTREGGRRERRDRLEAGDFSNPALRRQDATTQLVDVVLRHPGYSDRNIGKVLSILLSVEYAQALHISEQAPCVIAWGIGRERAQTFKNVIEGAGGKVLLVEPGTFE